MFKTTMAKRATMNTKPHTLRAVVALGSLATFFALSVWAQDPEGPALGVIIVTQDDLTQVDLGDANQLKPLRKMGLLVFTTPFNTADGLGDGPFDPAETPTSAFGHRPTLQGNGQHLRLNGLDAQSCNECHVLVSHATEPPTLGIGGVGGVVQNAVIMPSLIDVADSFEARVDYVPGFDPDLPMVFDGVADFNGRFANPPFLFGGGGVELLGKEMTADLQDLLAQARQAPAGSVLELETHGTHFGHVTSLGNGEVELDVEGIGPEHWAELPAEEVLVVRPFGRKGENFSMRDFDRGAMQFHFGIQPVEVIGENIDEDGDGIVNEITVPEMSLLHIFDVTNPKPVMQRLTRDDHIGFETFLQIGCSECHRPEMKTRSRDLPLAHPEVATDPYLNVYNFIDLWKVGFDRDPVGDGVIVPLFADLKRHDMGPGLAETFERGDIANSHFTTARLWGIADTAPYLHDGRATTLYEAITLHGGEADTARLNFLGLSAGDQSRVIGFLKKLRTPRKPNEDILP